MKRLLILLGALLALSSTSFAQRRQVGDIIMINGELGVVYAVTSDGLHGKVMSVAEIDCDWTSAKKWCSQLGGGWKLPLRSDLPTICNKRDKINQVLKANGYTEVQEIYWTSEEYDKDSAWVVNVYFGGTGSHVKYDRDYVRAVSAF
jgi:hypothetical protein